MQSTECCKTWANSQLKKQNSKRQHYAHSYLQGLPFCQGLTSSSKGWDHVKGAQSKTTSQQLGGMK